MNTLTRNLLIGAAAGLVATWIKLKIEPPLQEIGEQIFPPTEEELNLLGADVINSPENMPSAVLIDSIYESSTGYILPFSDQQKAMYGLNMATGIAIGAVYSTLVTPIKAFQIDQGILAGAFIWGLTHGTVLPRLGLQDEVEDMPRSWFFWELGSHVVYGIILEQTRRMLNFILPKRKK